ncbi:MAG: TIGR03086 family protein [Actinomycetia bacterium]|nr:TIGR03086 family protein [Actinomycetes bacterium]MCP4962803.1 TIGR03086 family protein [Actinomycetes bacterium]
MNPDFLARAQKIASDLMAGITSEQLELSTPCAKWNVGELIEHMIGAQYWALGGVTGSEPAGTGEGAAGGDYSAGFAEAAAAATTAFGEEGALERTVNLGFGDIPATALLELIITDTFTHAWDLANATGQDTNLDPQMAAAVLEASRQSIQPAFRSETGDVFGLEQPAPDGSNAMTQLAAFLGRNV